MDREATSPVTATALRTRAIVLASLLLVLLFFWRLGAVPLLEPDEGRYTEVPREMLASGDFVTPHLNGVLYFEKPPLCYWLNAAAISVFGLNEFAARLAGAVLGVAGIGAVFLLGGAMAGRRAGLLAGVALATTPLYVTLGRLATIDMTLTFFLTTALGCFWLAHREEDARRARRLWLGVFAAAALAVLAKGLIGVVIPGAIVFFYLLATRAWRMLTRVPWLAGSVLFLAIAAPWHVLAALRNPDFVSFYFVHEHFLRYFTPIAERQEPFWFFLAVIGLGCVPWSGLLPSSLRLLRGGSWRDRFAGHEQVLFLTLWAGIVVAFFSVSQSKLIPYVLPAVPPLAILAGIVADRLLDRQLAPSKLEPAGMALAGLGVVAYGALFVVAGLGRIDRPALAGVVSPGLLVPGAVVAALAVAIMVVAFVGEWRRKLLVLFAGACCLVVAVLSVGPLVARERSSKELVERMRNAMAPGTPVYCYRDFSESLPVYLRHAVGVVEYRGELAFGASHLSRAELATRFPAVAEFQKVWNSPTRVVLVVSRSKLDQLAGDGLTGGRVLATAPSFVALTNPRLDHR